MRPIKLSKEEKYEIMTQVKAYFDRELSAPIGDLAAELLIDFMMDELEPYLYNAALTDARAIVHEKMNQLDDELYVLEKPVGPRRNER